MFGFFFALESESCVSNMKQKRRQRRIRWTKKLLNIDGKAKNCSNLIDRSKQREKKKRNERNIPIKWTKNPHFFHFSFVFLFGSRRVVVVTKVDNGSKFAEIVIGKNLSMITFTWLGAHCCRQHSVFFFFVVPKIVHKRNEKTLNRQCVTKSSFSIDIVWVRYDDSSISFRFLYFCRWNSTIAHMNCIIQTD